jgi:hypothetical protein
MLAGCIQQRSCFFYQVSRGKQTIVLKSLAESLAGTTVLSTFPRMDRSIQTMRNLHSFHAAVSLWAVRSACTSMWTYTDVNQDVLRLKAGWKFRVRWSGVVVWVNQPCPQQRRQQGFIAPTRRDPKTINHVFHISTKKAYSHHNQHPFFPVTLLKLLLTCRRDENSPRHSKWIKAKSSWSCRYFDTVHRIAWLTLLDGTQNDFCISQEVPLFSFALHSCAFDRK